MMQQTLRASPAVKKRAKSVYQQRNLGTIKKRKKEKQEEKEVNNGETILRILRMRCVPPCPPLARPALTTSISSVCLLRIRCCIQAGDVRLYRAAAAGDDEHAGGARGAGAGGRKAQGGAPAAGPAPVCARHPAAPAAAHISRRPQHDTVLLLLEVGGWVLEATERTNTLHSIPYVDDLPLPRSRFLACCPCVYMQFLFLTHTPAMLRCVVRISLPGCTRFR